MGMLNNINQLLITRVFWDQCINFFVGFLGNYGWAIILFTVTLKLILTPLDVLQRLTMKKQTRIQAQLKPQLEKLQQTYGNDREKLNQKTQELYARNNVNLKSVCLPMLATLVVTSIIFFTLFGALNNIAKGKESEIFYEMHKSYTSQEEIVTESDYVNTLMLEGKTSEEIETIQKNAIKDAVLEQYNSLKKKHGFLWVQNLWKSDTTVSPLVDWATYRAYYSSNVETINETNEDEIKNEYEEIKSYVLTKNSNKNGYFLLILIAGLITFLVQYLSQLSMKKNNNGAGMNKIMLVVLPLFMLIFAYKSNALFSLYIITNSIVSAIISKIIDEILKKKDNSNNDGRTIVLPKTNVVEYSRNYKR